MESSNKKTVGDHDTATMANPEKDCISLKTIKTEPVDEEFEENLAELHRVIKIEPVENIEIDFTEIEVVTKTEPEDGCDGRNDDYDDDSDDDRLVIDHIKEEILCKEEHLIKEFSPDCDSVVHHKPPVSSSKQTLNNNIISKQLIIKDECVEIAESGISTLKDVESEIQAQIILLHEFNSDTGKFKGVKPNAEKEQQIMHNFVRLDSTIETKKCNLCRKIFISEYYLQKHLETHLENENSVSGSEKPDASTSSALLSNIFKCEFCDQSFNNKAWLSRHKKIHLQKLHQCLTCEKNFDSENLLKLHYLEDHTDHQDVSEDVKPNETLYSCFVCEKKYESIILLRLHILEHNAEVSQTCDIIKEDKKFSCSFCGKMFKHKRSLKSHVKNHIEKKLLCSKCQIEFGSVKDLNSHKKTHSSSVYIQCDIDGISSEHAYCVVEVGHTDAQEESKKETDVCMDKSVEEINGEETSLDVKCEDESHQVVENEKVACKLCSRKCRTYRLLANHMKVHSNVRPFHCKICNKSYKEYPTLQRHMRTHRSKEYQCDFCKKFFVEKSTIRRHLLTLHRDGHVDKTKDKFFCQKCCKLLPSQSYFDDHVRKHGNPDYECNVCGKVYSGRSHLEIHKRIHGADRPFKCKFCPQAYKFKHVLKVHYQRVHSKYDQYLCHICSKTFQTKVEYLDHAVKTHEVYYDKKQKKWVATPRGREL